MDRLKGKFTTIFEAIQVETKPQHSFALILMAPPEIAEALDDIRRRYDPAHKVGIPPHITIKRPAPLLQPEKIKVEQLRQMIGPVARSFPPIQVQLQGYGIFRSPGRNVVFLKVKDEKPFCQLHMEVIKALSQLYPNGQADQYEGEQYHPHLTIGNQLSDLDLAVLERELSTGAYRLDFSFVLTQLHLYVTLTGQAWETADIFNFNALAGEEQTATGDQL